MFTVPVSKQWRPPSAVKAVLSGTVRETSGRTVSAYTSRMIDVYPFYLGVRLDANGSMIHAGSALSSSWVAVDNGGNALASPVPLTVTLSEIYWSTVLKEDSNGKFRYVSERILTPVSSVSLSISGTPVSCVFPVASPGHYLISGSCSNAGISASTTCYAVQPGQDWHSWSMDKPGRIDLALNKESYTAGETATLLIKAPFTGTALLTIESDRVLESRVINLDKNTLELSLPVKASYPPNVYCSVCVIRPVKPGDTVNTHRAAGIIPLRVSRPDKKIGVSIDVPDQIRPNTVLPVSIHLSTNVIVEITVAAVDEGICMLTDLQSPDPLLFFESQRRLSVSLFDLYSFLMPEIEDDLTSDRSDPGGDSAPTSGTDLRHRLNPVSAKRFKPVALWSGTVLSDTNGSVVVPLVIPEFSGSLRLMVVAAGQNLLGCADDSVIVKRKLIVQTGLPRFLAPADTCSLPVRVFNETGSNQVVQVSVSTDGPLSVSPSDAQQVVASDGQFVFPFTLTALDTPGKGTLVFKAWTTDESWQETIELPVRPPSSLECVSDFGSVGPGSNAVLSLPANWFKDSSRNNLWCSGYPSVTLAGGIEYLLNYPYGCIEQTTSSSFPLLYLADLAAMVRPGTMGPSETAYFVQSGIYRVLSMQQYDGSFSYWPQSISTYDYGSIYATHFLVEAEKAGYSVPAGQKSAALHWLEKLLDKKPPAYDPKKLSEWQNTMCLRTYACFVLALSGRSVSSWLPYMQEMFSQLSLPSRLNVVGALAASGQLRMAGDLLNNTGIAGLDKIDRETSGCLNSDIRSAALLLSLWMDINPQSPYVPVLVNQLQNMKINGGWYTTQDNAMALMALGKYARFVNAQRKPFSARVAWNAGAQSHSISDTQTWHFIPVFTSSGDISIANAGPGTLYFSWQSQGIPASGTSRERDQRISIRRTWLDLNGSEINAAQLKQGELVIVKLTLDTGNVTRRNIIIEDLLPAGLEIENPNLKTSQLVPWTANISIIAPQNIDMRDDRVIISIDSAHGIQKYFYAVRAVTTGTFIYPPASAECMYDPMVKSVHGKTSLTVTSDQ